jgi:hypothetical protein
MPQIPERRSYDGARNPQSVYSLLGVPYNVLATKQSDPMLCKFLKMRLRKFSNPLFRTIALIFHLYWFDPREIAEFACLF